MEKDLSLEERKVIALERIADILQDMYNEHNEDYEQNVVETMQSVNENLSNINSTLFDTLGSKEVGDALRSISNMN